MQREAFVELLIVRIVAEISVVCYRTQSAVHAGTKKRVAKIYGAAENHIRRSALFRLAGLFYRMRPKILFQAGLHFRDAPLYILIHRQYERRDRFLRRRLIVVIHVIPHRHSRLPVS